MDDNQIKENLKRQIEIAWSEVAYPGDSQIVIEPDLLLGTEQKFEDPIAVALLRELVGVSWKHAVPLLFQTPFASAMWFLTPAAFHYYLPAYLCGVIDWDFDNPLNAAGENFLSSLDAAVYSDSVDWFLALNRYLRDEQKKVIQETLQHLQSKWRVDVSTLPGSKEDRAWDFWEDPFITEDSLRKVLEQLA